MSITLPADLAPYRARRTSHEPKFAAFLDFVDKSSLAQTASRDTSAYAIELVTQINFGPVLSKRYFASGALGGSNAAAFVEVTEAQVIEMNLKKANSYKNFRSATEDTYFEMNLYFPVI
ncbi:hypothetical protein B0H19DRAFT_1364953 [Mycena capillaripes]|nr:hypothetical protein B0H19DRAFT_1364953 [Mycena capillaripes]